MLLLLLQACIFQTSEWPAQIPGSTWRIDRDVPAEKSEIRVDIHTNYRECVEAKVEHVEDCLPRADRASGEVHLSFRLRDPQTGSDLYRAIAKDQLKVTHDNSPQSDMELIPHEPTGGGQLHLLVIDGSGSMYERDGERIKKLYSALLSEEVVNAFYPPGNGKTGVVLVRFNTTVAGLDGGPPRVLQTRDEYVQMIREHLLRPTGGYTHLYGALQYALTELVAQEQIATFLTVRGAEPSIILLTDGFNNEAADDTCATNVPRLQAAVDMVRAIRTDQSAGVRPVVHAVGLGVPYRKGSKPKDINRPVNANDLCGQYADYRIDPDLEDVGIDHVSLAWIAEVGGGISFVKNKAQGLAKVLASTAATRYRWFEVWYRVPDSFYHRKSFAVQIQLLTSDRAFSTVRLMPSGWLDAPSAERPVGSWHVSTPFRSTLSLLMPALGVIVLLTYVGPAMFNARRAIFRRARPRRR